MKHIFLTLIAFFAINVYSQNSNQVNYEGGNMYMISLDSETKEEIFNKPIGKVIVISYDSFYKSYLISYDYMGQGVTYMKLNFLRKQEQGWILMKEETYGNFSVLDSIKENGVLVMIKTDIIKSNSGNSILMFKIDGIKK